MTMESCPLRTLPARSGALLVAGVIVIAGLMPLPALASDRSAPYRSYPGFFCRQWNSWNECTSWTYFDARSTTNRTYDGTWVTRSTAPVRCTNARRDCTGSISVHVSAAGSVRRGDVLTYDIFLRNNDSQWRTVDLRAFLDRHSSFQSASGDARLDGATVRWANQSLAPRSGRSITLTVRVRPNVARSNPVLLRVLADGKSDTVSTAVLDEPSSYTADVLRIDTRYYDPYQGTAPYRRVDDRSLQYYYDASGAIRYRTADDTYYGQYGVHPYNGYPGYSSGYPYAGYLSTTGSSPYAVYPYTGYPYSGYNASLYNCDPSRFQCQY